MVFDKDWFKQHQKGLLFLTNTPVIKYWFRWVLRINSVYLEKDKSIGRWVIKRTKGISFKERIIGLQPNSYTIDAGLRYFWRSALLKTASENYELNKHNRRVAKAILKRIRKGAIKDKQFLLPAITTDFRTHDKFAKRLYLAFYPLWMAMHLWDLIADSLMPKLSFGFSTLTAYPVAGANSPCDGITQRGGVNETFGTIRAGAGTLANRTNDATQDIASYTASATTDQYAELIRGLHNYDTSIIGAGGTISDATESIEGTSRNDGLGGGATINIFDFNPAATNDIAAADYGNYGTTAFSTAINFSSWNTAGYNDFVLNASGLANINKTGISSFGTREVAHDVANVAPATWSSGGFASVGGKFADTAGTTSDPKLVVTYTGSIAYTITCVQGSYTLTGQALAMLKALRMTLVQGAYTLTGQTATLFKGYTLVAAQGAYTLTGQAVTFLKALRMTMAQGAYTLTGQVLTLTKQLKITLVTGYYTLTGQQLLFHGWLKRVRPSIGTWTPRTLPSSPTYTKRTKPDIGTWTKRTKPIP